MLGISSNKLAFTHSPNLRSVTVAVSQSIINQIDDLSLRGTDEMVSRDDRTFHRRSYNTVTRPHEIFRVAADTYSPPLQLPSIYPRVDTRIGKEKFPPRFANGDGKNKATSCMIYRRHTAPPPSSSSSFRRLPTFSSSFSFATFITHFRSHLATFKILTVITSLPLAPLLYRSTLSLSLSLSVSSSFWRFQ